MNANEYDILHFTPDMQDGVLNVLSHLWGDAPEKNLSYFQWKYLQNPYTADVLGIVALHKEKVVGFRGYFATQWEITESQKDIILLCPGDTCVHPAHRRKRLSMLMGNMAMNDYAEKYPVFLNFSANNQSVPGYLRMGFLPLFPKAYMNRAGLKGMISYILSLKKTVNSARQKITFGDFGNILVSDAPMPAEMSGVTANQAHTGKKIRLKQDEKFFQWRFHNQRKRYVFYYYKQDNYITGYIVLRVSENNRRGFIIDYAAENSSALKHLLAFISKKKHFNILSIYAYGATDEFKRVLKSQKFRIYSIFRFLERRAEGEWPLLVRPVRQDYDEKDFFIQGLDIRKFQNWSIKEICSDGS